MKLLLSIRISERHYAYLSGDHSETEFKRLLGRLRRDFPTCELARFYVCDKLHVRTVIDGIEFMTYGNTLANFKFTLIKTDEEIIENINNVLLRKMSMSPLEKFLKAEQKAMYTDLRIIVRDAKADLETLEPEQGCDEPSIDVRLCIDPKGNSFDWIFRTGDASFDQRHSVYCSASSIGHETSAKSLLRELIDSILDDESVSA